MADNIVIREATAQDIPAVVDLLMRLHNPRNKARMKNWFMIMMDGRHPHIDASNFIIAEDADNGRLAASITYMPWTYSYGGARIKGVRLEEVFCELEYQNRGIAKSILRRIEELSDEKGYLFECVYGKRAVYGHLGFTHGLPNEEEGYSYIVEKEEAGKDLRIVKAGDEDISAIAKLYEANYARNLLTTMIGPEELNYSMNVYMEGDFYVVKRPDGDICGFFHTQLKDRRIYMMELDGSVSYHQLRPHLLAFYRKHGLDEMKLKLGKDHPAYMVFNGLYHKKLQSSLGFAKVRDIPGFLMGIADVLAGRLAGSPYAHYTGAFTLATHNRDEAYRLVFDDGRLAEVHPAAQEHGEVDIERGRFVRLLFGRVSPEEMDGEFAMYCFRNSDLRNLFAILFPEMQSHVVSVN